MADAVIEIEIGPVQSVSFSNADAGTTIVAGRARLMGWSVAETSGAASATLQFTSGSVQVGRVAVYSGNSDTVSLPATGVECPGGVGIGATSGAFSGVVYVCLY